MQTAWQAGQQGRMYSPPPMENFSPPSLSDVEDFSPFSELPPPLTGFSLSPGNEEEEEEFGLGETG